MIDDLGLQGITEPYRMLTARAEYRLRLRADNAATRLTPIALAIGCVGTARREWFTAQMAERESLIALLNSQKSPDPRTPKLFDWIRVSGADRAELIEACPALSGYTSSLLDEAIEDTRYAPYLARQDAEIRTMRANEGISLEALNYAGIAGLSHEMVEKLNASRPVTLGAAERVRGITPAALALILVHAKRKAA
jgi:tRNA uridine 5-carboxymethylaminomethyl modification enzyme